MQVFLDSIAHRQQEIETAWRSLIHRVADGENVAGREALKILRDANKSEFALLAAVGALKRHRLRRHLVLYPIAQARDAHEKAAEAARRKLQKAEARLEALREATRPLWEALDAAEKELRRARKAEEELLRIFARRKDVARLDKVCDRLCRARKRLDALEAAAELGPTIGNYRELAKRTTVASFERQGLTLLADKMQARLDDATRDLPAARKAVAKLRSQRREATARALSPPRFFPSEKTAAPLAEEARY